MRLIVLLVIIFVPITFSEFDFRNEKVNRLKKLENLINQKNGDRVMAPKNMHHTSLYHWAGVKHFQLFLQSPLVEYVRHGKKTSTFRQLLGKSIL